MRSWREPLIACGETLLDIARTDESSGDNPSPEVEAEDVTDFIYLVEEGEYERTKIGDLPANQIGRIKEERGIPTLIFDPENVPHEALLEVGEEFEDAKQGNRGFAIEGRGGIAAAVKTEGTDGLLDQVYGFYRDKLPRHLLPVLKDALVLRITISEENITKGEVYEWRGDIGDSHRERGHDPQDAQNLISLCSAGYFDRGRFFRNLYEEMVEDGPWSEDEYGEAIADYVRDNPFAVFVRSDGMTPEEVLAIAFDKARKIDKYPGSPGFVDVCGVGRDTHEIIDKTLEGFLDMQPDMRYESITDEELDQYILRIDTDTI